MVAVISGNGLGLFNSSIAQTGRLHGGAASLGQGNHSAMVNIANGNLVLAGNDESVDVNSFSLNILRTYNSLGTPGGDLQQWLFSFDTRLEYVAPLPSPGAKPEKTPGTFYRYAADGSVTVYNWDPARGANYSSDGDGAADFVRIGPKGEFEWVDGTTREVHIYDQEGRLTAFVDRNGNRWSIQREQWGLETPILGKIYAIESDNGASADSVHFDYGDFGELRALLTYQNGKLAHKVEYTYEYHPTLERPSRLSSVRTHHLSGGGYFETRYQYESIASDRIVGLRQSDGVEVSFHYDAQGRVREVRRGSGLDGPQSVLTYLYDTANRKTTVQDGAGQAWVYAYDTQGRLTEITEPAVNGQRAQTRYTYDARSNLRSVLQGRVNALNTFVVAEQLSFDYDANDNLIWERDRLGNSVHRQYNASNQLERLTRYTDTDPDGDGAQRPQQGLSTRYVYDSQNNLRFEIDALGNVIRYQVNQAGQVTRRTSYISAVYSGPAEFASMETWANGTGGAKQITDYTYDFRGLLAFEEQYATTLAFFIDGNSQLRTFQGASVQPHVYLQDTNAKFTAYTYDPQGLLRQVITYRGDNREFAEISSMTYDGMGRLLTQVDPQGRTTSTVYNDAARTITTSFANGLISRTETRDSHGRTVSVMQSDGTNFAQGGVRSARNYYDALGRLRASEDAAGGRSYFFYDAAGHLESEIAAHRLESGAAAGQLGAEVDATGTVTRYTRDHAGRVLTATRYAQQVVTTQWVQNGQFVGSLTLPASDPVNDRVTQSGYDEAGRLSYTIDGEGTRSNFFYDGANRLIRTEKVSASNPADVRRVRNFYDAAGRLTGTLDEENYVVEHFYDRLGQLVKTQRYETKSAAISPETATFDALRPPAPASPPAPVPKDEITRYFYNGRGQRVGTLDAEMYLTHSQFAETSNQVNTVRYSRKVELAVDDSTTLNVLLSHLTTNNSTSRSELHAYNSAGDLVRTEIAGLITTYEYNTHGQLILTRERDVDDLGAVVTREQRRRLNGFGQVVEELPASAPENRWDLALKHEYDARGLRIQTTDAEGNRTWYFYDAAGRTTHELRGQSASVGGVMTPNARVEVSETLYNAFGEASSTIAYSGLVALQPPYNYAAASQVIQGLNAIRDAAENTRINFTYERRGQLLTTSNPLDQTVATSRTYDGFGALAQQKLTAAIRGVLSEQVTTYSYNARGMLNGESLAHVNGAQSVTLSYDAFGRVSHRTDARDHSITYAYDRLGRQVSTTRDVQVSTAATNHQALSVRTETQITTYDAFSRVLTETDAQGSTTSYTYEAIGTAVNDLLVSVTTPEGVTLTTHRNHRGSTLKVEDPAGQTTRYYYDLDGRLKGVKAADHSETETRYDSRGLVHEAIDATGRITSYTYDAAGRVLTRTENAQATNASQHLTTRYAYDGQGRQIRVTDASGRLTTYEYWQDGQIKSVVRGDRANPAGGLEITSYTYDAQGRQLTVVQGEGATQRTTQYQYDEAGRRVAEIVDPAGLNIRTAYEYDANGNLIAKHNPAYAAGSSVTAAVALATPPGVTRMVYDAANRLVFSIDPTGAVTQYHYDTNGQLTWTRAYATRPTLPTHPAPLTLATMLSAVSTIANAATDVQSNIVRDRDGRERFILNADGSWTQYIYNSLGQRHQTLVVGQPNFTDEERLAIRRGDSLPSGVELDEHLATHFDVLSARRKLVVFDALGRPAYTLTPDGESIHATVSRTQYDAAGRVIAETQYGPRILLTPSLTVAGLEARLQAAGALIADQNRQTHYVYDGAGRPQYTLSETAYREGAQRYAITEQRYDGAGRVASSHVYRDEFVLLSLTADSVSAALVGKTAAITRNEYDAAGRRTQIFDALNSVEKFAYDASGMLVSYTDRENHTWTYTLDNAGRRIREQSPQTRISYVDADGNEFSLTRAVYTRTDYDALGNVVRRVEDENFENLTATTFRTRATEYVYDARGLQIQTRFPRAGQLDSNGRELIVDQNAALPTRTVTYDALGRAVVQQDVRGNYSYKIYDRLGNLRYEIDQERYVTEYAYNAYGEQSRVTRYANRIDAANPILNGNPVSMAQIQAPNVFTPSASADRQIDIAYDRRGRKTSITQSALNYRNQTGQEVINGQPRTNYLYNSFGEMIQESVLLEHSPSERWAHTYHWYDEGGRRVMTVDAERYVTTWSYDARGLLTQQTEYARALASGTPLNPNAAKPSTPSAGNAEIGMDRVSVYDYDSLGRRTLETLQGVSVSYGYDKEGRLIQETRALDTSEETLSTRRYDALGRLIELREPVRRVFVGALENAAVSLAQGQHYVERITANVFSYDAFGNATRTLRAGFSLDVSGNLTTARDQREGFSRYDHQGRLIWQQEGRDVASRKISWRYYDAADNVEREVSELKINHDFGFAGADANQLDRIITTFTYDAANRQTTTDVIRQKLINGSYQGYYRDSFTRAAYNAFGEITRREVWKENVQSLLDARDYTYDRAGRLVSSNDNAQGAIWRHGYNLAGVKVYEQRRVAGGALPEFIDTVDLLGRATQSKLPRNTDETGASAPTIQRQFDRWGNVIGQTDARGFRSDYQYDHRNLVIQERAAGVRVVHEDGTQSTPDFRPTTQYVYDLHGRLKETVDANGVRRYSYYAANGDLQSTRDGERHLTYYAYNSVGEQVLVQKPAPNGDPETARGQVIYREHDDRGRLTEQGDYQQQDSGGFARSMQQHYVLNQDGHRLLVTNGMNQSQRFTYNSRGEVTASRSAMGVEMHYKYDELGRRVLEKYASLDGYGRNEQTWAFNTEGQLTQHTDLGGRNYTYINDWGLRTDTRIDGVSRRVVSYYESGLVKSVTEGSNTTTYHYDEAGNIVQEENRAVDGGGMLHHARTLMQYDSNGRIETVTRLDLIEGKVVLDLRYSYDAVGNRRSVTARSGYGPGVIPPTGGNPAPVFPEYPLVRQLQAGRSFVLHLSASDPNNDPITYTAFAIVGGEERSIDSVAPWLNLWSVWLDGNVVARFNGIAPQVSQPVQIRLYASDGTSRTAHDFTLEVAPNTAPVYTGINPQNVLAGQNFSLNVANAFNDSQSMTFSHVSGLPAGLQLSAAGLITGAPAANAVGTHIITVRATDSGTPPMSTNGSFQLTVNASNSAPQGSIPAQTTNVGAPFSLNLANHIIDPDQGQLLTFSLLNAPAGLSIVGNTLSGTVSTRGSHWVTVRATDNGQPPLSTDVSFQLTANGGPVVVREIADVFQQPENTNPVGFSVAGAFSDPDSQPLTFSAAWIVNGVAQPGLPPGLAFSAAGAFTGLWPQTVGAYAIRVTASDGIASVSDEFVIHVSNANLPPRVSHQIPPQELRVGDTAEFYLGNHFVDPEGSTLTFGLSPGLPQGAGASHSNGLLRFLPTVAGVYNVTVTASDGINPAVPMSFRITVTPATSPAPVRRQGVQTIHNVTWQNGVGGTALLPLLFTTNPQYEPLTYQVLDANLAPSGMAAVIQGNQLMVSGIVLGYPPEGQVEVVSFWIRARDSQGTWNTQADNIQFNVSVSGPPLRIEQEPIHTIPAVTESLVGAEERAVEVQGASAGVSYTLTTTVPPFPPTINEQTYWFTYDGENRVRIANGQLVNGAIQVVNNAWGWDAASVQVYDGVGNVIIRATAISSPGQQLGVRQFYDLRGQLVASTAQKRIAAGHFSSIDSGNIVEKRYYDNAGRLSRIDGQFARDTVVSWVANMGGPEPLSYDISGFLQSTRSFEYDADGRLQMESSHSRDATVVQLTGQNGFPTGYSAPPEWVSASRVRSLSNPSEEARIQRQVTTLYNQSGAWQSTTDYGNGYDGAGRLTGFVAWQASAGGPTRYAYSYEGWDGWQESSVVGTRGSTSTTTTSEYDAQGRRTAIREQLVAPQINRNQSTRYLAVNADGQVLARRDGRMESGLFKQGEDYSSSPNPPMPLLFNINQWNGLTLAQKRTIATDWSRKQANSEFVYVNGAQVAGLQEDGRMDVVSRVTGFASSSNGTTQTVVSAGENLRAVAQRLYGTSSLWYVLAAANGLQDDQAALTAGSLLNVPQVQTSLNDAGTFKPYSATENAGSTLPNVPHIPPAPKASCNPLQIVMIVVAVVVTVYTAGAAAGVFANAATAAGTTATVGSAAGTGAFAAGSAVLTGTATVTTTTLATGAVATTALGAGSIAASAAIGGFAGSVASQLVGKALGVTDSFSLRQAVGSGLTAGLTAGAGAALSGASGTLGKVLNAGGWRSAASNAVVSSLASQAGARLAGLDTSFSWRSVAANAVAASISSSVTNRLSQGLKLDLTTEAGQFGQDLLGGAVGGVVSLHTRRAAGIDQRVDYGQVAVDAFGNAIANALTGEHSRRADAVFVAQAKAMAPEALHSTIDRLLAGMNRDRSRTEALEFISRWATNAQSSDPSLQRSVALGREYLEHFADLAGEERADAISVLEIGFEQRSGVVQIGALQPSFGVLRSNAATSTSAAAAVPKPWLGHFNLDSLVVGTGEVATIVGQEVEARPWLKYSLMAAEVAAGPVLYAGRTAVGAAFEQQIAAAQEAAIGWAGGHLRAAGRTESESVSGGVGVLALGALAAGGVAAALLKLKSVSSRLDGFLERLSSGPSSIGPGRQWGAIFPNGERPSGLSSQHRDGVHAKITVLTFNNIDDFNRAAQKPVRNTRYEYGGYAWTTDSRGRVAEIEGMATPTSGSPRYRTPGTLSQADLGKVPGSQPGDVGFHLIGHQFGGPINPLNVVPGNGNPLRLDSGEKLTNINRGRYYSEFEAAVARVSRETGAPVPVRISVSYGAGNTSVRPDAFIARYQLPDGRWRESTVLNRAGG